MSRIKSCKNCTDRTADCHISCERYAADKAANDAAKEARAKESLCTSQEIRRSSRKRMTGREFERRRRGF